MNALAHPALVLILAAPLVAVLPRRFGAAATTFVAALGLGLVWRLEEGVRLTHDLYGLDLTLVDVTALARPFALVFATVGVLGALYGWSLMNPIERAAGLATVGAGLGVVLAGDLISLFLFWEFKVVTVVLLIAARGRPASSAAAQRYLHVHLAAGVVLLGGVIWQITTTGSAALEGLGPHTAAAGLYGPGIMILIGVLIGAAAVPFHAWLPDAYPAASLTGAVLLSAITTKSAVYVLARTMAGTEILIWIGVAMALVGVTFAMLQDNLRRLLSYHIVSQVGFMVAAIGVGTAAAVNGATAHATAHVLYKGLLLMAVGALVYATGRDRASALGGLARTLPVLLVLYMVGALSISGLVGFSGFPAKELAVSSVGSGGASVAKWALKFASVGTFLSVGLKLPALAWGGAARGSTTPLRSIPATMYVAMGIAAAANLALGLRPSLLFDLLPTPESFAPFTVAKIAESTALLAATAVGFLLWRYRLIGNTTKVGTPTTSMDTDAVYRELPAAFAARRSSTQAAPEASPSQSQPIRAVLTERGQPLLARARSVVSTSGPVAPGWLIGGSVAGAMVLVLTVILAGVVI